MPGLLVDTDVLIDFLRARDERERETLASFVDAFRVIPVDRSIVERGGSLRRSFGPSHGTGLADALIAATAQEQKLRLATLNQRHFPMIEQLVVPCASS